MEIASGVESDLPREGVLTQLVPPHHDFPLGTGPCSESAAGEITALAAAAQHRDRWETGVRTGAYQARLTGGGFRVRHSWNPAVEVVDVFLEAASLPTQLPEPSETERRWISTRSAGSRKGPPGDVLEAAVNRATVTIEAYRKAVPEGQVPDTFPLGEGMTAGDTARVLAVIMRLASLCEETAHRLSGLESARAHMPTPRLTALLADMCPTVSATHRALAVERLTHRTGRSCRTSPTVPYGDAVIICPPLITPRAIEPITLRSAAHDSEGSVISDVNQATVQPHGPNGRARPGCSRRRASARDKSRRPICRGLGRGSRGPGQAWVSLCSEIKWPIEELSPPEAMRTENWVTSAARRSDRLRDGGGPAAERLATFRVNRLDLVCRHSTAVLPASAPGTGHARHVPSPRTGSGNATRPGDPVRRAREARPTDRGGACQDRQEIPPRGKSSGPSRCAGAGPWPLAPPIPTRVDEMDGCSTGSLREQVRSRCRDGQEVSAPSHPPKITGRRTPAGMRCCSRSIDWWWGVSP